MAWHDSNWNGRVCCNPEGNTYCTGAHSLLSGRIEKKKDLAVETREDIKGQYVEGKFSPESVPPCYWSINAFSDRSFDVEHHHAFSRVKHTIKDKIKANSVVTWPFKLSFVHGDDNKDIYGNYWPDLNTRIDNYISKFTPKESIIFFYANYDNPVSADDMKYLLLGCSVISELPEPNHFGFTEEELTRLRAPKKKKVNGKTIDDYSMSNFPTLNWMLQFTHDPTQAVVLPYQEYLKYAETHPDSEELLQKVKVLIEEDSLVRGFKYVSMDIDDDKCLYLLYKLRKAIKIMQDHNQQVVKHDLKEEENRIDTLIRKTWEKRGVYPSLHHVLDLFIQDADRSLVLATEIKKLLTPKYDLGDFFAKLATDGIRSELNDFEDDLMDISENRLFLKYHESYAKLSLLVLTKHQIGRIDDNKELLARVKDNPYVLYEEYQAEEDDLDIPDMQDEPIDVFKVDMGMIPDSKRATRHRKLQNLKEDSPERVRSVIINYLWRIADNGHCYDSAEEILAELYDHPLIYKNDIKLDDDALLKLDQDYKSHFIEKLHIHDVGEAFYFYLNVVKDSEKLLSGIVNKLIERVGHGKQATDIQSHISESLRLLKDIIKTQGDKDHFSEERRLLYNNIFDKSFFLLTGKPGAGKTYETSKIIEHLYNSGEEILVLAPTGKAALRITENIKRYTKLTEVEAVTIDKYIYDKKFGWIYDDWESALEIQDEDKITVDNLIIDESSMLDLKKLTLLLSIIKINDKYPKRIILVGDENQLPPIGLGKPFHDTIEYIQGSYKYSASNYINLTSNCRQENDQNILKLAEAFTDKTRCYEEAFEIIEGGEGKKSEGLFVYSWSNQTQLNTKVKKAIDDVLSLEDIDTSLDDFERINQIFGLYENGYVNQQDGNFTSKLKLENLQILSPYRTGYYGTLGLNKYAQSQFRYPDEYGNDKYFKHADKMIRLNNWYWGKGQNRRLVLSNGSIGITNIGKGYQNYFFRDRDKPFWSIDDEENFDLAYAITVHKSQGSDFRNVLLVVPEKQSLLSKELLYTALTRSKYRLFIFIQDTETNLLLKAKNNSHLIHRNTSLFNNPKDNREKYSPEHGVTVASKIEFIIYQALLKSGLKFKYEEPLKLDKLSYKIHPDFTIILRDGKKIFWEHLGMVDTRKYYRDWQDRKKNYDEHGYSDVLLTTDDLNGVKNEKISELIDHIKEQNLKATPGSKFSSHHYELY
jgi:ATP-dependent exoDNAse (exonuclease V) alpha subunit